MDRLSGAVFEISKRLCQNSILVQPPYAREHIIYTYISAPFCLLSWEGVLFFGGCFLSNRLKKDFERFVCKEKRRTFVTAKAIPARLIEELFRRARRYFLGGGSGDEPFLERQP